MYENTSIPPPPVRMRTKFYSTNNFNLAGKDVAKMKPLSGSMANLTIGEKASKPSEISLKTTKPKHKSLSKGKSSFFASQKSSSKSLSNLVQIDENESFFSNSKRPDKNFRNYSVSSVGSNLSPGKKITSKSLSNLTCSKGLKPAFLEIKSDPRTCLVHRSLAKNGGASDFEKSRFFSSSFVSLGDSNWSLQSAKNFQYLYSGRWSSIGTSLAFG